MIGGSFWSSGSDCQGFPLSPEVMPPNSKGKQEFNREHLFKLTVVPPTVEATISVKDVTVIDTPACLRASPI